MKAHHLGDMWARHHAEWRDSSQVASQWREASETDPRLLRAAVRGAWWEALAGARITLLVTREYEHLLMAMTVTDDKPHVTYMPLPHPSGLTVDRGRGIVHVASTRNPNQLFEFEPVRRLLPRRDVKPVDLADHPLVPVRSRYFAGSLYIHDLALIGSALHANSVGQNAVVRLDRGAEPVWWPRCIEGPRGPEFGRNHLQLNSIAAGDTIEKSFYSASASRLSARRPGHRHFPVDGRGVVFSGATREPVLHGLTRPHSARLHRERLWVDNSGYGEVGFADGGTFVPVAKLHGWTRGLCFHRRVAFVGTSRVIPRFSHYAPGLDVDASECGIHAVDVTTGRVLGSIVWPYGNQIFAIDWIPTAVTRGFPFAVGRKRATLREKTLFYSFQTNAEERRS